MRIQTETLQSVKYMPLIRTSSNQNGSSSSQVGKGEIKGALNAQSSQDLMSANSQAEAPNNLTKLTEDEDDRYEIIKFEGNTVIRQEKLLLYEAIIILLAVSLPCLPNLIPPMLYGPIQTPIILFFFFCATVLSCYFLYELSIHTTLSSYPEIAYFLGGGRASIIFLAGCFTSYFITQPTQYIVQMNLLIRTIVEYRDTDHSLEARQRHAFQANLITVGLIIALYPLCMTRKFVRLKILAYMILFFLFLFYIMIALMIFQVKPGYYQIKNDLFQLRSCWTFVRSFFEIFGIQVYFLWILQTQKRSVLIKKKTEIILYPTTGILFLSLIFVLISYLSINVNVDYSKGIYLLYLYSSQIQYIQRFRSSILDFHAESNWSLTEYFESRHIILFVPLLILYRKGLLLYLVG